jgi:uncharacterized cupin superfamily protein
MEIINIFDKTGMKEASYGPKYNGAEKEVATLLGAKNIGFHLEVLNPKTFSCPYHYHTEEEELFIMLEGEAIFRKNGEFKKVKAGDLIYCEIGFTSAHQIYNHSELPFKYFVLSTKIQNELCHYPDSKKVMERATRTITQNGVIADYFKDEEDPSIYWPPEIIKGNIP